MVFLMRLSSTFSSDIVHTVFLIFSSSYILKSSFSVLLGKIDDS